MLFDPEKVLERTGGPELLALLVSRLSVLLPRHLQTAEEALARGDSGTLERTAHSIKGALVNFEAPDSVAAARALEGLGAQGRLPEAPAQLEQLRQEIARLLPELRRFAGLPEPEG